MNTDHVQHSPGASSFGRSFGGLATNGSISSMRLRIALKQSSNNGITTIKFTDPPTETQS